MGDFNGSSEYSKIRIVNKNGKFVFDAVVYPVPAREEITIDIISDIVQENANIIVLDMTGKMIQQRQVILKAGITREIMNLTLLQTGNYIIKVSNGEQEVFKKIVKFQ